MVLVDVKVKELLFFRQCNSKKDSLRWSLKTVLLYSDHSQDGVHLISSELVPKITRSVNYVGHQPQQTNLICGSTVECGFLEYHL